MAEFTASEFLLAAPTVSDETFSGAFAAEGFLTAPALSQEHPLPASGIVVSEYSFLPVGFTVGHVMTPPIELQIASPDYASPVVTQNNILVANDITSTPVNPTFALILRIPLEADGFSIADYGLPSVAVNQVSGAVAQFFEVSAPLIRAARLLSADSIHYADEIAVAAETEEATLSQVHFVGSDDLDGNHFDVSDAIFNQTHVGLPDDLSIENDIAESTFISQDHALGGSNLQTLAPILNNGILGVAYTPSSLTIASDATTPSISQDHMLDPATVESTIEYGPADVSENNALGADGISSQIELPSVGLAQDIDPVGFAIAPYRIQRSAFQSNEQPIFQEYQFDTFQRYDAFQPFAFLGYAIGILNQVHTVAATIELAGAVNAATSIEQVHAISGDETTNIPVLDSAILTQVHELPAAVGIGSQIDVPSIVMIQTARLFAVPVVAQAPVGPISVALSQIHRSIAEITIAPPSLPTFFLRQNHNIAPAGTIAQIAFDRTSVFAPTIIATYDLFTAISYVFELDQDADAVEFVAPISCDTSFRGFNFGLPRGVTFQGNLIEGVISPSAKPGFYYFEILVTIDGFTEKRPYAIRLTNQVNTSIPIVPKIEWTTRAGSLGQLREGDASYSSVAAGATTATPVTFALRSGSLPAGLTLAENGEIRGVALPVLAETSYTFTVRASTRVSSTAGTPDQVAYEDRSFSLTVDNLFSAPVIYDVFLKPTNQQSFELKNPYRGILTTDMLFRPTDPNFGIPRTSLIYLLGGVGSLETIEEAVEPEEVVVVPRTPLSFHEVKRLKIGEHGIARARDVNGNVVYEVLYRLLDDPQATAGGFSFPRGETRIPVVYNDGSEGIKNVFPNSIRNARSDLIQKVGFAVTDPGRARTVSSERLPLWMRSRQVASDPTSVLSFVPAIVIAYVKPGFGEEVSRVIAQNSGRLPRPGRIININTYFVKSFPSTNDGAIFLPDAATA